MPIYDYTYQSYRGARRGPLFRWMAIPRFALMDFFGNRTFIALFCASWIQFILRLSYVYLLINVDILKSFNIPTQGIPPIDAFFFKNLIDIQFFFCLVFSFMLGANLISRDLAHNALVLYVSKPISRWEYFFGKFSVVFFMSILLTWVQGTLIYVLQVAGSPASSEWRVYFWSRYARIYGAMTLYCVVIGASLSMLILAASSLVRNGRKAGLIFAMYLIGSGAISEAMVEMLNMPNLRAISLFRSVVNLGHYLFHTQARAIMDLPAALIGIASAWAICGLIIWWRMNNAAKFSR